MVKRPPHPKGHFAVDGDGRLAFEDQIATVLGEVQAPDNGQWGTCTRRAKRFFCRVVTPSTAIAAFGDEGHFAAFAGDGGSTALQPEGDLKQHGALTRVFVRVGPRHANTVSRLRFHRISRHHASIET